MVPHLDIAESISILLIQSFEKRMYHLFTELYACLSSSFFFNLLHILFYFF